MAKEQVEVAFEIELNTRKLASKMAMFDRSVQKTSKDFAGLTRNVKHFAKDQDSSLKKAEKAMEHFEEVVTTSAARMEEERVKYLHSTTKEERAAASDRIKILEEENAQAIRIARDAAKEATTEAKKAAKFIKQSLTHRMDFGQLANHFTTSFKKETDWTKFRDTIATELKGGLEDGFSSFKGKDLSGLIKGAGKFSSGLLKGVGGTGAAALFKANQAAHAKSEAMGGTGATGTISGKVLKGLGNGLAGMGKMVGMLAKLGPLLAGVAGAFAAIVSVILGIEDAAKGMNKEILESAGSADMLYANGGDANKSFNTLRNTLDDIRYSATDVKKNLRFGMKAEDILNVTKGFTQAGVSLTSLNTAFENAETASKGAGSQIQNAGDLARMSFGYAKLYGVSLSEVTDLQAEMFTEMGTGLSGVQLQFAAMAKDASESGIATNKFFGIIRGISSDLSLYTTRIGQATGMLKLLGKAMSSKEAGKFMQGLTNSMKGMSEQDRIRTTMLIGQDKARGIVMEDLAQKSKFMAGELQRSLGGKTTKSLEDISKLVDEARNGSEGAKKELKSMFKELPKEQQGALSSALFEMTADTRASKHGPAGIGEAMANLSAGATYEAKKAALERFGGAGKVSQMSGIQGTAARQAAGVSLEESRGIGKLEESIGDQKDDIIKSLANPSADPKELAAQQRIIGRLKDMGITGEEQIKAAKTSQILNALEVSPEDALKEAGKQTDWAEKTANLTTTVSDKLGVIVEGIFEFLYVAMRDVVGDLGDLIDLIASFSLFSGSGLGGAKHQREQLAASTNKDNKGYTSVLREARGDKTAMLRAAQPMIFAGIDASIQSQKANMANYSDASLQDKMGGADGAFAKDLKLLAASGADFGRASFLSTDFQDQASQDKQALFQKTLAETGDVTKAMGSSGFTPEDAKKLFTNAITTLGDDKYSSTLAKLETGVAGSKLVGGGSPSEQAAASAKAKEAAVQPQTAKSSVAPGVATPSSASATPATAAAVTVGNKMAEVTEEGSIDVVGSLKDLWTLMATKGIKLNKTQLEGEYKKVIRDGALDAIRTGMFEYAMYTSADPTRILDQIKKTGLPEVGALGADYEKKAKANASGGLVTGISGGLAQISPASGEGLASIGRGERIVPAGGGGGGSINVNVNGIGGADLANLIRGKVAEGIYEYKRKEKLT